MIIEIEKIFIQLIQQYMNLPNNYGYDKDGNEIPCVTIKSQNIKLFNTPHLQITISTLSNKIFSNRKDFIENESGYFEKVYLNEHRQMQIDVYSRNNEARERFYEVQASLGSSLAEQLSNQYQFRIGKISNSFNLSGLDGGSDINRFTIRFDCLSWQEKVTQVDYYNTFQMTAQKQADKLIVDYTINEEERT